MFVVLYTCGAPARRLYKAARSIDCYRDGKSWHLTKAYDYWGLAKYAPSKILSRVVQKTPMHHPFLQFPAQVAAFTILRIRARPTPIRITQRHPFAQKCDSRAGEPGLGPSSLVLSPIWGNRLSQHTKPSRQRFHAQVRLMTYHHRNHPNTPSPPHPENARRTVFEYKPKHASRHLA